MLTSKDMGDGSQSSEPAPKPSKKKGFFSSIFDKHKDNNDSKLSTSSHDDGVRVGPHGNSGSGSDSTQHLVELSAASASRSTEGDTSTISSVFRMPTVAKKQRPNS